jgi:DNA-directed RNA polymerase II subunit RPB1
MTENNQMFAKLYETMCTQLANYHKGEVDKDDDGKSQQVKSISSSMMTKEGRIRANMLGKKVVNMGRAVIACDTTNPPDVITIPLEFAMSVYVRETVRSYNRERLQKVFDNGPHQYPGAVYVVKSDRKRY